MTIKENFLELSGYRLPTDQEWEHACRAGTVGTYAFGESVSLLDQYSQYAANSAGLIHPAESLLPNEAGLFDMHGNVWEWTQNPTSGEMTPVRENVNRYIRGGSIFNHSSNVRSVDRTNYRPSYSANGVGFRPARTARF